MLNLTTFFDEKGELIGATILPKSAYAQQPTFSGSYTSFTTECPDMQTALTVASAWERTGRKP